MVVNSKTEVLIAATVVAGTTVALGCFLMYKRKKSPDASSEQQKTADSKTEVNAKRKYDRKRRSSMGIEESKPFISWNDSKELQDYFLREILIGEEELDNGDSDAAVEHLCNALGVCSEKEQFLIVLKEGLSPDIFTMVLKRLSSWMSKQDEAQETEVAGRSNKRTGENSTS